MSIFHFAFKTSDCSSNPRLALFQHHIPELCKLTAITKHLQLTVVPEESAD